MRTQLIAVVAVIMLGAPGEAAAQTPSTLSPSLVGSWKSAPDETPLTTELQKSVWGPNATSIRNVELTINPSGEGTLKVTTRIVDGRGRTAPASTTVEDAKLVLTGPQETIGGVRTEYAAKVLSAERKYPDDPSSRWPLDGLRVKIATIAGAPPDTIELRFDTAEGRGSFWETLTRVRRRPAPRSSQ
jgi:hypothetical protein